MLHTFFILKLEGFLQKEKRDSYSGFIYPVIDSNTEPLCSFQEMNLNFQHMITHSETSSVTWPTLGTFEEDDV